MKQRETFQFHHMNIFWRQNIPFLIQLWGKLFKKNEIKQTFLSF